MAFSGAFNRPLFNDNINDTLVHTAKEQGNKGAWIQNPGPSYGVTPSWSGGTNYWSSAAGSSTGSIGGGESNWSPNQPVSVWIPDITSISAIAPTALANMPTPKLSNVSKPLYDKEFSWANSESGLPSMAETAEMTNRIGSVPDGESIETRGPFSEAINNLLKGLGVDQSQKIQEGRVADEASEGGKQIIQMADAPIFSDEWNDLLWGKTSAMDKYNQPYSTNLKDWIGVTLSDPDAMKRTGWDKIYNPVGDFANASNTLFGAVADARNILFDTGANKYFYDINGQRYYQNDLEDIKRQEAQFESTDDRENADWFEYYIDPVTGEVYSASNVDGGNFYEWEWWFPDMDIEPQGYSVGDDGNISPIVYREAATLADGTSIPWEVARRLELHKAGAEEVDDNIKNIADAYNMYWNDEVGRKLYYDDIRDSIGVDGYQQEYSKINLPIVGEISGLDKANPDDPLTNPRDILPWLTDAALQSLPYFIPVAREAVTLGQAYEASRGYDPMTFDYRSGTYSANPLSNWQVSTKTMLPFANYLSEGMGGFVPESLKKTTEAEKAIARAGRGWLNNLARDAAMEGLEEVVVAPLESASNVWGPEDFGANQSYDDATGQMITEDTPLSQRLRNFAGDVGNNFLGGALIGGAVSGTVEAPRHMRIAGQRAKLRSQGYKKNDIADLRGLDYTGTRETRTMPAVSRGVQQLARNMRDAKYGSTNYSTPQVVDTEINEEEENE